MHYKTLRTHNVIVKLFFSALFPVCQDFKVPMPKNSISSSLTQKENKLECFSMANFSEAVFLVVCDPSMTEL